MSFGFSITEPLSSVLKLTFTALDLTISLEFALDILSALEIITSNLKDETITFYSIYSFFGSWNSLSIQ